MGRMLCVVKNSSNLWAHELMSGICFNPYLYVTAMAPTYDKSPLAEFWKSNSNAVNIKKCYQGKIFFLLLCLCFLQTLSFLWILSFIPKHFLKHFVFIRIFLCNNEHWIIGMGLLRWLPVVKNSPANAGDAGDVSLIPGLGRSSGGGYDNPLQYSCLENPLDRGAWWATVHGGWKRVRHDWMTEHLYIIHGSWLDALMWNLQIWRAHWTMRFYKVDLSICGFWYSLRSWN